MGEGGGLAGVWIGHANKETHKQHVEVFERLTPLAMYIE